MANVITGIVHKAGYSTFIHSVLSMVGLILIATVFGGLRAGTLNYTTAKVNRRMRRDLFRSITGQEIAFFDQVQTGNN